MYVKWGTKETFSEINQTLSKFVTIKIKLIFSMVTMWEKLKRILFLKATRTSAGRFNDIFEIRGILETYRTDLKNSIEHALIEIHYFVKLLTWNPQLNNLHEFQFV